MQVQIVEVGPRDGLQNEQKVLSAPEKIRLIEMLAEAGLQRVEASSFVNPKWIPQLADAGEVCRSLPHQSRVRYSALVPNLKGLERARECGLTEVALFMSASETHNLKNINKSIEETFPVLRETAREALALGMRVRGYVSTVFGCPYEGEVPLDNTRKVTNELISMGVYEVSIGDTIGVATPLQVHQVYAALVKDVTTERLAGHFHDTRGTGLANVAAALDEGIRIFDSSIGGLGGCPYAPGASGNISSEDLVYMLHGMGYETGVSLEKLVEAGAYVQQLLGRALPSKVLQAALAQSHRRQPESRAEGGKA
ncbi:hydroxymethylglutaryl-CoA lyase [Brevibacillus borstelensis]|jgi:hydroxymethylglutaryl-CoA lyase|uniref:hydroxymethylglutaryl-CoA lyase n=1 Tax=Brevibacillus borstelensis TaxID=45462 RepID=UPI000F0839B3|nr:hydroxymethylglutaryl-CoA lyase [Brevibacillus borstelensis]MCM3589925.1 hydroxymethylglutaryl-CoA lyase [Brevibacillus borstelensis]MED1881838.1 hydroxymethylglutaryl-CoA lyase [Brevibacillus borstelensis]RNB62989.1 hydroxymethylglutaryl-CoA lyase [Brevibacillus borstelensis]GED53357.1 hydroxymethylglutaryl-CoA lyase [Brevibacillus borstelensis]